MVLTSEKPIGVTDIEENIPLLQTYKQIRSEASRIFYSENIFEAEFEVDGKNLLAAWLKATEAINLQFLCGLKIVVNADPGVVEGLIEIWDGTPCDIVEEQILEIIRIVTLIKAKGLDDSTVKVSGLNRMFSTAAHDVIYYVVEASSRLLSSDPRTKKEVMDQLRAENWFD